MWFYGYFTNEYSVNCTNFCEEIHGNSDNSDVIVLLKTEHFICLKEQHGETKKTIQNSVILLKYKVYSSLQIASEFSMIGVPDFIDETGGMTRPSVSTSSSSIHSNSWNWNAHSSSFCRRAATRCGQAWKLNRFSRLLTWWFRGNIRWSCPLLFVHLFMQIQFFN